MTFSKKWLILLVFFCLVFSASFSTDVAAKSRTYSKAKVVKIINKSSKSPNKVSNAKTAAKKKPAVKKQVKSKKKPIVTKKAVIKKKTVPQKKVAVKKPAARAQQKLGVTKMIRSDTQSHSIKSLKIYYGDATPSAINTLSHYDAVIIEPYAFSKNQVQELRAKGTKVYGYLSVMELEDQNKKLVDSSDYFIYKGKKYRIPKWKTYIMDIAKSHYRNLLMDKVNSQIAGKQMDGVFLDTVGDIDDYFSNDPNTQNYFRSAYLTLLKTIKASHPNLALIQNWGFETVRTTSLPLINGVLWEDFNQNIIAKDEWSQNWIRYFQSQSGHLTIMTVSPDAQSVSYANQFGFVGTLNSNDVYNNL